MLAVGGQHLSMTLGGRRFLLACAVVAAGACLALGFSLPFMRLTKLVFLGYGAYGHSLLSAVNALVRTDQLVLGGAVLVLAILLPLLRLLYLLLLAALPPSEIGRSAPQLRALAWLGRWSPQDLVAFALTAALVASRETLAQRIGAGAYFFAAAVVAMLVASVWLQGDTRTSRLQARAAHAARAAATRGRAFPALVALATLAFVLGVALPSVRLVGAYAGTDLYSLAGLIWTLHERGETVLWVALALLAIVLPGLRLLHLLTLVAARGLPGALRTWALLATGALGRYAIADTMVLALALLYLVAAGQADAPLQPGAYGYAAFAVLTLVAYGWSNAPRPASATQPGTLAARLAGLTSPGTAGEP